MSANHFYHKQSGGNATRRERALVIDRAKAGQEKHNPDTKPSQQIRKHIRQFLVASVCMGVAVLVSMKVVRFIWSRNDQRIFADSERSAERALTAVLSTNTTQQTIEFPPRLPDAGSSITPPATASQRKIETIYRWGKVLEDAGEYDGALDRYQEALNLDPNNVVVLSQIGRLHIRRSRYGEAVYALSRAYREAQDNADIANDLGVAMTFNDQASEAVALYESLLQLQPNYMPAKFNLSYALVQLRELDRARPLLEEYIASKPDDPMAIGVLAVLEISDKNYVRALELLDRAIEISPSWGTPYLDAASVCALTGENDRSLAYLERALDTAPPGDVFRHYKGTAFDNIRLSDQGKEFEKKIAMRARAMMR
jgi:tetratricopeptide (TPR) repeat protein